MSSHLIIKVQFRESLGFLTTFMLTVMAHVDYIQSTFPVYFELIPQLRSIYTSIIWLIGAEISSKKALTLVNYI